MNSGWLAFGFGVIIGLAVCPWVIYVAAGLWRRRRGARKPAPLEEGHVSG